MSRPMLFFALAGLVLHPSPAMAQQESAPESHLFFGATARSLAPGHGYVSVRELGFGAFQVGVTDRLSFGAGTVLFYPKVVVLTPKYQLYRGQTVSVAAGVVHLTRFGDEGFGAAYGVVTKAFERGSLTTGGGILYARADHGSAGSGVAMIGGERRISSRVVFVTENYIFFAGGGLASAGVRLIRGRFAADLGVMAPFAPGSVVAAAPVVNFGWKF